MHLAQAAIKCVLTMLGNRLVDAATVGFGRLKALWDVLTITAVIGRIYLLRLAPPAWVNNRVQTGGACTLLRTSMRVIDLETTL